MIKTVAVLWRNVSASDVVHTPKISEFEYLKEKIEDLDAKMNRIEAQLAPIQKHVLMLNAMVKVSSTFAAVAAFILVIKKILIGG